MLLRRHWLLRLIALLGGQRRLVAVENIGTYAHCIGAPPIYPRVAWRVNGAQGRAARYLGPLDLGKLG